MRFRFTVVDSEKRRVSDHVNLRPLLVSASKNPQTVEALAEEYRLAANGGLYLARRVIEERLTAQEAAGLAGVIGLDPRIPLEDLISIARSPNFKDYAPDQRIGTSLKPTNAFVLPYDGAVVFDLRARQLAVRGQPVKNGPEGEPTYQCFGRLTSLRTGEARERCPGWTLDGSWTIKDLVTGAEYRT